MFYLKDDDAFVIKNKLIDINDIVNVKVNEISENE